MKKLNHAGNVIISICGKKINSSLVKSRLSAFYRVSVDEVIHTSSETIDTYLIHMFNNPYYDITWYYKDEVSFTGLSYPIVDTEILKNRGGKSIKNLVNRGKGELPEMWKVAPPLGLFYHHVPNDSLTCYNDFLGVGKIYTYNKGDMHIVSSTPLAIALVAPDELAINEDFWDAYYTFGGGIGNHCYYKNVHLVDGGSKVVFSKNRMVVRNLYGYTKLLNLKKGNQLIFEDPVDIARQMILSSRGYLPENILMGISGGRDSRFIAALAIDLGLDFTAYTSCPPEMEGDVAERLFSVLPKNYGWHRQSDDFATHVPQSPILERTHQWFEYQFGDSWSTLLRMDFDYKKSPMLGLSGFAGEIARGHDYDYQHLKAGAFHRLQTYLRARTNGRPILPFSMKYNAVNQYKLVLFEALMNGIDDFYLLDFAFAINRIRRQYPIRIDSVSPIFSPQMAIETFWHSFGDKISARYIMDKTNELIPQWKGIKYMHELTENTDPNITNKTHTALTFWELNRDDFFDSIQYVINHINTAELTMTQVEKNIRELPEGRPRTAKTYEHMFWRAGFKQTSDRIDAIRNSINTLY